jgi:hypothetical protein
MRLMIACVAAVAAVAFAAPSFAQEAAPTAAPATSPAKPKVGTTAYCNSLKSTSSKTACLKRLQASAAKPATPVHKAKAKKPAADPTAAPKETSSLAAPSSAAPTPTPVQQAQPSTIVVPPLPQKTI